MRTQIAALAALCLVAGTACAQEEEQPQEEAPPEQEAPEQDAAPEQQLEPKGSVDVYYVPTAHVEASVAGAGSGSDSGDGFGASGRFRAADWLEVTAEYQAVSYDDFGDLNQYRVGVGLVGEGGGGLFVEYIAAEDSIEADGFGVHAAFRGSIFYGQFGYLRLDEDTFEELSGFEWVLGFQVPVYQRFAAFADVRRTGLGRDGSDLELETADVRAGVRIGF
jgi:hypothetical protein